MGTEEVEIPKPKPRKKAVKKEEPEIITVSSGIQITPEIPQEEKETVTQPPFVEVKPEPVPEPKKATVEVGTEEPVPIISEPPAPKPLSHNLRNIIILCIIILIAAGLGYWAVLTLW